MNLVGCDVKKHNACSYFGLNTPKCRLKYNGKNAYLAIVVGSLVTMNLKKKAFNNKVERDPPRKPLNKEGGFQLMESIENKWGEK